MATSFERFTITTGDGFRLAAGRQTPGTAPKAVIQLSHGMAEHIERYAAFADACADQAIAVFGHDHRGHGGSVDGSTPLGHYGDVDGWRKVTSDLLAVRRSISDTYGDVPVILFAHSMGSIIARSFLFDHASTMAGVVLSATNRRIGPLNRVLRWVARREIRRLGPSTPSPLMTRIVFGSFNRRFRPGPTGFEWLSRDPAVVAAYVADPKCGFQCTGQLWSDLFGGAYDVERREDEPANLSRTLPLLLIAGSDDPVSKGGLAHRQFAKRYRAAGNARVEVHPPYPQGRHEMLNELNRAEVWDDVLKWVRRCATDAEATLGER